MAFLLSSPGTPAAASDAGFGGAQSLSNRFVFLPAYSFGGLIAERTVRTMFVVFDTPAFQDNARLVQTAKEFAVKAFIAQLVVKSFQYARFPKGFAA